MGKRKKVKSKIKHLLSIAFVVGVASLRCLCLLPGCVPGSSLGFSVFGIGCGYIRRLLAILSVSPAFGPRLCRVCRNCDTCGLKRRKNIWFFYFVLPLQGGCLDRGAIRAVLPADYDNVERGRFRPVTRAAPPFVLCFWLPRLYVLSRAERVHTRDNNTGTHMPLHTTSSFDPSSPGFAFPSQRLPFSSSGCEPSP